MLNKQLSVSAALLVITVASLACIVPDTDTASTSCVPLMDEVNPGVYACMCVPCTGGLGCCRIPNSLDKVSGTIDNYRGTRRNVKSADEDGTDTAQIQPSSCQFRVTYICGGESHTQWLTPENPDYQDIIPAGNPCKKSG